MAKLIHLPNKEDSRGSLTIIDQILPFEIKRVFYITGVPKDSIRGGHRHHKTRQALICVAGSCEVTCNNGAVQSSHRLQAPQECLIVEAEDFHHMLNFSTDCVLLVLASEHYDKSDYIHEDYLK